MTEQGKFSYIPQDTCVCGGSLEQGNETIIKEYLWGEISFRKCPRCGSWIQSPQVSSESLKQWYDSGVYTAAKGSHDGAYLNYINEEEQRKIEGRRRYERDYASILKPHSNVLEIGCATASLLAIMKEKGHAVFGVDISDNFGDLAKKLNDIEIFVGGFETYQAEPESFDLVIMLGTITSIRDLVAVLEKIRTLLKENGHLFFNIPVADSLPARIYGERFWQFAPSVNNFMTTQCCLEALKAAGLKATRIRQDYQSPTLSKLLSNAKLSFLYSAIQKAGLEKMTPPFSFPIPGVKAVWATRDRSK